MSRGRRQLFISSQEYVPIYFTFIKWTDLIIFTIISEASIQWNLVKYRGSPTPNSKTYWRQTLDTFRDLPLIHKNEPPLHLKHVRWHCKQGCPLNAGKWNSMSLLAVCNLSSLASKRFCQDFQRNYIFSQF